MLAAAPRRAGPAHALGRAVLVGAVGARAARARAGGHELHRGVVCALALARRGRAGARRARGPCAAGHRRCARSIGLAGSPRSRHCARARAGHHRKRRPRPAAARCSPTCCRSRGASRSLRAPARGSRAIAADIIDGRDLVRLAERELMAPLDAEARRLIAAASKRVSVVTAHQPARRDRHGVRAGQRAEPHSQARGALRRRGRARSGCSSCSGRSCRISRSPAASR